MVVYLKTGDGAVISAVYLPAKGARYTILYSHGNGEDIGKSMPFLRKMSGAGYSVFAYDYHGYGTCTGRSSEANAYRDIETAYDYLVSTLGVSPDRIIAYGRSLGGAVTINLAARRELAGLVVESSFLSALKVATRTNIFPLDRYRSADKISRVRCPVLIIHGRDDRVVPFKHGEELYRLAKAPKSHLWVDGVGHNDLIAVAGDLYWGALRGFIDKLPVPAKRAGKTP